MVHTLQPFPRGVPNRVVAFMLVCLSVGQADEFCACADRPIDVTPNCAFQPGTVNGASIRAGEKRLAVYGWNGDQVDHVLLTHGRRDIVWRGATAIRDATVIAPAREKYLLEKGPEFWAAFPTTRYHDYAQQTTKIIEEELPVDRWVSQDDTIQWNGITIGVLETPGFTRGSATYVVDIDGKRIGFTGDLIYGDGKLFDLYSFQDAIPEAQVRGYHGYAARLGDLVTSLDKIIDANLDVIVPARGPLIETPSQSAAKLKSRVQAIYRNYLSTNALHWYFKEDRMRTCGRRVLGEDAEIELMPYANHQKTPDWIFEESTSRLLISESGRGFLLDCGTQRVIDQVNNLIDQEVIEKVDGIFVTHYHDDHTNLVQAAAEAFECPVYATPEYADVLERPEAYHLPAMTENAIHNVRRMTSGQTMNWHEFELTFHFFPGQAFYHGALLVKKPNERPIFFIGDAFAPSGIDDYCLLNRNLLHDDEGYLFCLNKVREANGCWLINEHIRHVFEFSAEEMEYLEDRYRKRRALLAELFPWDDPNYGIDEQWAVFNPRWVKAKPDQDIDLELRITNHSPSPRRFEVTPHLPPGIKLRSQSQAVEIPSHSTGAVSFKLQVQAKRDAVRIIKADIDSEGMSFPRWADAQVTIEP